MMAKLAMVDETCSQILWVRQDYSASGGLSRAMVFGENWQPQTAFSYIWAV